MIALLVVATLLAQAPDAGPDRPGRTVSPKSFTQQVEIQSDRLEIQGKKNQAVWMGHVKAKRGDTLLACDQLVAHYTSDQQISKIECLGSVEINDGDRWAKGERADFDNIKGVLVVTGSPEARQGPNHMKGTKVTFHMQKDLIEVQDPVVTIVNPRDLPGAGLGDAGTKPAGKK